MTPGTPSRTAEVVTFMRAAERLRPPQYRIVDDPYASWFLGPGTSSYLAALRLMRPLGAGPFLLPTLATYVAVRHRYMDDALRAADRDISQVVVLGAGYDMRAYRFADLLHGRPVFEVDYPATAARKAAILERHQGQLPLVDRRAVTIDFQTQRLEDRLAAVGFQVGKPTFFFWEGVSMYLRRQAVKDTLTTLARLGGEGSHLTMDFWMLVDEPDLAGTVQRTSASLLHLIGEPITFGSHPEDVGAFLDRQNFRLKDVSTSLDLYRRYVRDDRPVYRANFVIHAMSRG